VAVCPDLDALQSNYSFSTISLPVTTPPDNVHIALSAGEIEQQPNVHPYQTMHELATAFAPSHTHTE